MSPLSPWLGFGEYYKSHETLATIDFSGFRCTQPRQKRIRPSFLAKGCDRSVSREHAHVVAQWQQLVANRREQHLVISSRQVCAANRSGKQHVAHKRHPFPPLK